MPKDVVFTRNKRLVSRYNALEDRLAALERARDDQLRNHFLENCVGGPCKLQRAAAGACLQRKQFPPGAGACASNAVPEVASMTISRLIYLVLDGDQSQY